MAVWHLALATDWDTALPDGEYRVSTLGATLAQVGFIHCAFAPQLPGVVAHFYRGVTQGLVLLEIEESLLACGVRVEAAESGEEFPHVYGPIAISAVVSTRRCAIRDGRLVMREGTATAGRGHAVVAAPTAAGRLRRGVSERCT